METQLLQTKLHIPPIRSELISRPRLMERLNVGLRRNGFGQDGAARRVEFARKLTLVSAPAGFGKTTLLSDWAAQVTSGLEDTAPEFARDRTAYGPVAWLSLDEGDNDPVRFLTYIIAALQMIEGHLGEDALGGLLSPKSPPRGSVLTALINQIAAIPHSFVLVLDDYHVITAQAIHEDLAFILDHLPANFHMVIATRSDPPLNLARLRGRGQLNELRQSDLSFTIEEVEQFLAQETGAALEARDVVALASRTEGWVAGLQMAALALSGQTSGEASSAASRFIQDFTGSNRYVLDYLVEEVLNRQPKSIQDFLLRTSILDRLSGPLCDAVCAAGTDATNRGNGSVVHHSAVPDPGQAVLEQLEHANLFIVPLDNERRWYRYHHLFADLLRQRLEQAHPELAQVLHGRASEWYERNGLAALAIEHALSAGDAGRAAYLIEKAATATFSRGEFATFQKWLESIPDDQVRASPILCVYHALMSLFGGRPLQEIESRLQDAEQDNASGAVSGEVTLLHALLAMFKGDLKEGIELSDRALALLPEDDVLFRGLVARNLASVYKLTGDVDDAVRTLDDVLRVSRQAGDLIGEVAALQMKAEMRVTQGRLREAASIYEGARELAVDRRGRRLPVAIKVLVGLGELHRQWNDLDRATALVCEGIEQAKKWSEAWGMGGYLTLARIRQAQGDVDGARAAMQTAERYALEFDATEIDDLAVAAFQARLWIAQGDLAAAAQWVAKRDLEHERGMYRKGTSGYAVPYLIREIERTTLARVYMAQGRPEKAVYLLGALLESAEERRRMGSAIEILTLRALALQMSGHQAQSMSDLERALSFAEPEGYVRLFLDEGEPMAQLLRRAASRDLCVDYARQLLMAFELAEHGTSMRVDAQTRPHTQPLIEPLSERELEVLRLFSEGMSNREVAQRLYLSLHTVKWHAGNIYGKLGVKNRSKAVAKARALGILAIV
jgi:LuxR family maltose regulon positive regulatory protein